MSQTTEIPFGFCQCGCGNKAPLIPYTQKKRGWKKGQPFPRIVGHNKKLHKNFELSAAGKFKNKYGYIYAKCPDHPRAKKYGYVLEHILVAEKHLGRFLKENEVVHHKNHKRDENNWDNLMVFESNLEHHRQHVIERALAECGNPTWRKCGFCKNYDDPSVMVNGGANTMCHKECRNIYQRKLRAIRKN